MTRHASRHVPRPPVPDREPRYMGSASAATSPHATYPPSGQSAAPPDSGSVHLDGKDFFRQARLRLTYEQFNQAAQPTHASNNPRARAYSRRPHWPYPPHEGRWPSVSAAPLLAVPLQHQASERPRAASQRAKTRPGGRAAVGAQWLRPARSLYYAVDMAQRYPLRQANPELSSAGPAKTRCCERKKSSAETTRIYLWRSRRVPNARALAAAATHSRLTPPFWMWPQNLLTKHGLT